MLSGLLVACAFCTFRVAAWTGSPVKPNFHMLGELFLNKPGAILWDILALLNMVTFLISYSLAGSQSYVALLGVSPGQALPVFCGVLTFCCVFLPGVVQPTISVMTLFKGSMLTGCVAITIILGSVVHEQPVHQWSAAGSCMLVVQIHLNTYISSSNHIYQLKTLQLLMLKQARAIIDILLLR